MSNNKLFEKQGALLLAQSDGCSVWQFRNETGDGTMTSYNVFPGIILSFNDFHMEYFNSDYTPETEMLAIDHCRKGRIEYTVAENAFSYMEAGDIKLDRRKNHTGQFIFPSCHYHGITVGMDLNIATAILSREVSGIPVYPEKIIEKFGLGKYPKAIRSTNILEHLFNELYSVPPEIRIPCFRIKVVEMLLYLYSFEVPEKNNKRPYFYKSQMEKVKSIKVFLTEHISENFTQSQLSEQFDIPLTTLKNCFKSIYGTSVGIWLTEYRMKYASSLLLSRRELNISEVAGMVGYDSASKFAMAFRKVMGASPAEYRREIHKNI